MACRKLFFHLVQLELTSLFTMVSQSKLSRRIARVSWSAWEYLHTRLGGILVCFLGDTTNTQLKSKVI
jgi:hypothetical protein